MKELWYYGFKKPEVRYRRYDSHPDIKEWEELVKRNPLYKILEGGNNDNH